VTRFTVAADGSLSDNGAAIVAPAQIEHSRLQVEHLAPHILTITLPKGERVNILVVYSCHCWSEGFQDTKHDGQMKIIDGTRSRAFCPDRFIASKNLRELLEGLPRNKIYLTRSDRNYGTYNATKIFEDGTAYTAFFTLKAQKGRFDGIRHKLRLFVESAYSCPQPEVGQTVKAAVMVGQALKGTKVKYYR